MITTPGHTRGCVCYQFGSFLFSGDTLFKGSIGRTDLDGGELEMALSVMDSSKAIVDSIQKKLVSLPYATTVLCGHGPITTLADEMSKNPYVALWRVCYIRKGGGCCECLGSIVGQYITLWP